MPFQRNIFAGAGPFFWVGAGIGARWLYGVLLDAPAANAGELITTGVIIGTICYALTVIGPIVIESVVKRRGE